MPLRLTYFDLSGRAEATRLALFLGDVDFEDKRISFAEFPEVAPTTPFKQLPVLEVDGVKYAQSTALLRYAGKLSKIYPEDPLLSLKVDEIVMAGEDAIIMLFGTLGMAPEDAKKARAELADGKLKDLLLRIVAKLSVNAPSPYFVGDSITIADLQIYGVTLLIASGFLDGLPTDLVEKVAPALKEHHEAVRKHPKVAAYYAKK